MPKPVFKCHQWQRRLRAPLHRPNGQEGSASTSSGHSIERMLATSQGDRCPELQWKQLLLVSIKAAAAAGGKWGGDGEAPQGHRQGEPMASWGWTSSYRSHGQQWRKTFVHSPLRVPFHAIGISRESLCGSNGAVGGVSTRTQMRQIKVSVGTVQAMLLPFLLSCAASHCAPSPKHTPAMSSPPAFLCDPGEDGWCWNSETHSHLNYTKRLCEVLQPHGLWEYTGHRLHKRWQNRVPYCFCRL